MAKVNFPMRARRGDPENGYLTVQQMLEFLRDAFDTFTGKFLQGNALVTNGNTSVVVGLPSNPGGTYQVLLTPLADPVGRYWASGKTVSQFVINLQIAAPVAGIPFDWVVKGA